jgi:hypothetical protein
VEDSNEGRCGGTKGAGHADRSEKPEREGGNMPRQFAETSPTGRLQLVASPFYFMEEKSKYCYDRQAYRVGLLIRH